MARPLTLPAHRAAIVGMTGSGKTFWAMAQFAALLDMAIYIDYAAVARLKWWAEPLRPLIVTDLERVKATLWARRPDGRPNNKCIFEPQHPDDIERLIAGVLAWKKAAGGGAPIWIFCDEIHNYSREYEHPIVEALFTRGRNFGVTGVAITQNLPAMRNTTIIVNCQVKVVFSIDPAAVAAFARNYQVIIPDDVLAHVNTEAELEDGKRHVYNAAVYGLSGPRWQLI